MRIPEFITKAIKASAEDNRASQILNEALSKHELFAKALFKRPQSLSQFLPYEEYLDEFGIFRQKDGSFGVVYEVTLCEHETKTSQQILNLTEELKQWFRLSEDVTLSLLYEQAPISPHDPVWGKLSGSTDPLISKKSDLAQQLFEERLEDIRQSSRERNSSSSGETPLSRRLYLSIRNFPSRSDAGPISRLKESLESPEKTLSNEMEKVLRQLRSFNHTLSQFELTSPLALRRLDSSQLGDILRRFFNPVSYFERPFAPINSNISISEQISFCSSTINYSGIDREGCRSRTLTLKNPPTHRYPGAMAYFLSLKFPFRICLNISFPSKSSINRHFGMKSFFLQNTPSARSRMQRAEVESLQNSLVHDDRVVHMTFCVLLEAGSEDELELQTKECLARFQQKLASEAIVETDIGFGLWINALPLAYHPVADSTTRRAIRIKRSDLVCFCPVFDSFRGTSRAQCVFTAREGGVVPLDFKSVGNSHMAAYLGDTGSGKSSQAIEMLLGELRYQVKPLIFVVDYKENYGVVSRFLKSERTTYQPGLPNFSSPFRGEPNDQKIRFLVHLLSSAILLTSPSFEIESEHRTCLMEALRRAYQEKAKVAGVTYTDGALTSLAVDATIATASLCLDDVIASLGSLTASQEFEKYGRYVDDLTKKLRPFYSNGVYAPFFRKNDPTPETSELKDMYIYDLDALSGDEVLQPLVTMTVVDEIRRLMSRPEAKQRGGYIVFEEFAMLGRNNPVAADLIVEAAETWRKLGFFMIPLTPNPRNYFETLVGKAIWAAVDHVFFMQMSEDNVNYVAEKSNLLDEATTQIVKTLRTVRGYGADVFYIHKSKTVSGAFTNRPTARRKWLTPTHRPDALEALKTLELFPDQPELALADLVKRFPAGTTDLPNNPNSARKSNV